MNDSSTVVNTSKTWTFYSEKQKSVFLFILFLVSTCNVIDRQVVNVLIEPIKNEFQVSDSMMGLLSGLAFAGFYVTLGIPVARWADKGNRLNIMAIGLTVWSLMTAICGLAQSFWQLFVSRLLVGAGESTANPSSQSLVADYYAPDKRGFALAILLMATAAGNIIGMVLGGQVAQTYGWRWTFMIFGLPGLLLIPLVLFVLEEPRKHKNVTVPHTVNENFKAALVKLKAKPSYIYSVIGCAFFYFSVYGFTAFLVSFMMRNHAMELSSASALTGIVSVIATLVGTPIGGKLSDKLAKKNPALVPLVPAIAFALSAPLFLAVWLTPNVTLVAVFLGLALALVMAALPVIFSCIHAVCGNSRRATSVAIAMFVSNLFGGGIGPVMVGALSDLFAISYGTALGLKYALASMTILLIPAAWFMYKASKTIVQDIES